MNPKGQPRRERKNKAQFVILKKLLTAGEAVYEKLNGFAV